MLVTTIRFRNMAAALCAFMILPLCAIPARSDGLPPSNSDGAFGRAVASAEVVIAHEHPLDGQAVLLYWAGLGYIHSMTGPDYAWGGEAALELRRYVSADELSGLNMSSYLGVALMDDDDERIYAAITPGIKLSYSATTPLEPIVLEPYAGLSFPVTREIDAGGGESRPGWQFPDGLYSTIGFRLVFR